MTISALATYADLQAAVASYCFERSDLPVAVLIQLAEAEMRADTGLKLRVEEFDQSLTGVQGSRFIALPVAYQRAITLWRLLSDGRRDEPMALVPAANLNTLTTPGIPLYWAVDDANIAFERPLDAAYSFDFRMQGILPALSVSNTTNWLLTNYPQVYLAAAMVQAARWLQDPDQEGRWTNAYQNGQEMVSRAETKARGNPTLRVDNALLPYGRTGRFNIYTGV